MPESEGAAPDIAPQAPPPPVEPAAPARVMSIHAHPDDQEFTVGGTLADVGQGKRPESWVAEVLAARDRRVAGMTAPPQGLFLLHVTY